MSDCTGWPYTDDRPKGDERVYFSKPLDALDRLVANMKFERPRSAWERKSDEWRWWFRLTDWPMDRLGVDGDLGGDES